MELISNSFEEIYALRRLTRGNNRGIIEKTYCYKIIFTYSGHNPDPLKRFGLAGKWLRTFELSETELLQGGKPARFKKVVAQLKNWIDDYNLCDPHSALGCFPPKLLC